MIVPFTQFVIIEIFLVLPLITIGLLCLIAIPFFYFSNSKDQNLWMLKIVPIFLIGQIIGPFTVDYVQRFRSDFIIENLEEHKNKKGSFPLIKNIPLGINYTVLEEGKDYRIDYSRGFLVTEIFYRNEGKWISRGWND